MKTQMFWIMFSILPMLLLAQSSITVLAPNGGEVWETGKTYTIKWTSKYYKGNINVMIKRTTPDGSGGWYSVAQNIPNSGIFSYSVPENMPTGNETYKVQLSSADDKIKDLSDGFFHISLPRSITVVYPNGGEVWEKGKSYSIKWASRNYSGSLKIRLKGIASNNAESWYQVGENIPNKGSFSFTVPNNVVEGKKYKIFIMTQDEQVQDQTDGYFGISLPMSITVKEPNGGELWELGKTYTIEWTSTNLTGNIKVRIKRSTPEGTGIWYPVAGNVPNNGIYYYTVPANLPTGNEATYKVCISTMDEAVQDLSDGYFKLINKNIEITALGDYPRDREPGWSDECQGVTTDGRHWYISQRGWLWKFPVSFDLNTGISADNLPQGVVRVGIPKELKDWGCNHFGDGDYFEGILAFPIDGGPKPVIAFFDAGSMNYLGHVELMMQVNAQWCAVNPFDRYLYSSNNDGINVLNQYRIFWELAGQSSYPKKPGNAPYNLHQLEPFGQVALKEGNGVGYVINSLEGGAFSSKHNLLYISSDKRGYRGIILFNPETGLIMHKYKVNYDPDVDGCRFCWGEQLKGLTIWEFTEPPYPPGIVGNLHLIMIDNVGRDDDDLYFKHFSVNIEVKKQASNL